MLAVKHQVLSSHEITDERIIQVAASLGMRASTVDTSRIRAVVTQSQRKDNSVSLDGAIISALTISETHFLRHRTDFEWIAEQWLPGILARDDLYRSPIEILSAGCSTGEEPYSLYAQLRPLVPREHVLAVSAVDIDAVSLHVAQRARYGLWSLRGVLPTEVAHWLESDHGHWCVAQWVRNGVTFSQHNLMNAFATPERFDLAIFRNVSIYFHADAIACAWTNLAAALKPHGVVVVGPSDPEPPASLGMKLQWYGSVRTYHKTVGRKGPAVLPPAPPVSTRTDTNVVYLPPQAKTVLADNSALDDYHLVAALAARGDRETALHMARTHAKLQPLQVEWHLLVAYLANEFDQTADAADSVRRALFLAPQEPFVVYISGVVLDRSGRSLEARRRFNWALEILAQMPDTFEPQFADHLTARQLRELIHARFSAVHS